MSVRIDALMSRARHLRAELRAVQMELHALRIEECGLKIGDVVEVTTPRHRRGVYRVLQINPVFDRVKPWVVGTPKRKDGTFGVRRINLFSDWEKQ